MATEYICDGCGKRYLEKRNNLTEVVIEFRENASIDDVPTEIMDLCTHCLGSFRRSIKSLREDRPDKAA